MIPLKRISRILIFSIICYQVVFLFPKAAFLYGHEYLSGAIMDHDGNATEITRIDARGHIDGRYKGKTVRVGFDKLKKIENLRDGIFRLTNLKNEQFNIEKGQFVTHTLDNNFFWNRIFFCFYDEISMQEKEVNLETFHTLTFGEDIGRLKYNPRTKKYYPPDYIFDPYTGEELVWRNPEY